MAGNGTLMRVDLGRRCAETEKLPTSLSVNFLGGRGLGCRLLFEELAAGTPPLAPENVVIVLPGPLQGTSALYSGKAVLVTKSPLTGIYLYSVASGTLGPALRRAGIDALVIRGRAETPTCLAIEGGGVSFQDASDLWGISVTPTTNALRARLGSEPALAVIGPAGEQAVRYAAVFTGDRQRRTFGRGGAGAVLGSKNLKAIAIFPGPAIRPRDPSAFQAAQHRIAALLAEKPGFVDRMRRYGTGSDLASLAAAGMLPSHNWQTAVVPDPERLDTVRNRDAYTAEDVSCGSPCPSPCGHRRRVMDGPYAGAATYGPEYETIYAFGTCCGIERFDALVAIDDLCDELGIDTMSAGLSVAFAMECRQRGVLPGESDGAPAFGDDQGAYRLVRQIAGREGLGDLLADGVRAASQHLGQGTEHFAMHSKGLELGGYECRGYFGQALQYALGSRGGCHHDLGLPARAEASARNGTDVESKGALLRALAAERAAFDSAIACSFPISHLGLETLATTLRAVDDFDGDGATLQEIGIRAVQMERLFNVREGVNRDMDKLPPRLTEEPMPDGPNQGAVVPLEALKDSYYRAMGWNLVTGHPSADTVRRWGLGALVPD